MKNGGCGRLWEEVEEGERGGRRVMLGKTGRLKEKWRMWIVGSGDEKDEVEEKEIINRKREREDNIDGTKE